ncbi:thylakoid lumenal 16.5 kDa protein, chloroplastic [Oryza brachyantha]|uniref:thylakoid lumenal 16.5 kDa protein, chloroplastic n=1 Tax=Oryza brachyantha TaxID=4533 RepID=UPI001ADC7091|nr:thylakoid lumenal 16.5 kDa protein, chloroplastic [Oryza brachyantha]
MVVAIATEAWALAGCGAAAKAVAQEAPVQLQLQQQHSLSAAKAKKPSRAVAVASSQCHQERRAAVVVGRRTGLASCLLAAVAASFSGAGAGAARAAILEADDDIELLERVKEDRKKRLQKQGVISSSGTETGYLQDLIYKLSKVGQAIDKNDLPAASTVLGPNSDAQWVQNVNAAFTKFSSSPEEKNMVDSFNSSLASLITSVNKSDVDSSKSAFVSSATTLEKWITSAGLSGQLKGF